MFVFLFIYVCVFPTYSGLAEERIRFPQGLSLVVHLYFRFFYSRIAELSVLVNLKFKTKETSLTHCL